MEIPLVILVIATYDKKYYQGFIDEYWIPLIKFTEKNYKNNIKIFLLFDNTTSIQKLNDVKEILDNIIVAHTVQNRIPGILNKTIEGFKYVHENINYKHILRTNLSSFFIIENLVKVRDNLPENNVYAGVHLRRLGVSGAGFWLSKDNMEFILNNLSNLNRKVIDDVSIGKLLKDKSRIKLHRYDIVSVHPNRKNFTLDKILKKIKDHYHLRIKNKDRGDDIKICKMLTKHFYMN